MVRFINWENVPREIKKMIPKPIVNIFVKKNYDALGEFHYKFLSLGMMRFMDQYNYDVERIMRCDIHYTMPEGRVVSFCGFNILPEVYRDYVQKQYSISFDEYEKKYSPEKVRKTIKLRRTKDYLEMVKKHPIYKPLLGVPQNKYEIAKPVFRFVPRGWVCL